MKETAVTQQCKSFLSCETSFTQHVVHREDRTYDAGHGTRLLQVAEEHFLLVEHLRGLMLRFLWMDEDRTKEVARSVPHPHLLNPVECRFLIKFPQNTFMFHSRNVLLVA